jgi:KipI family sensor histidine kinase inhibitor
VNRNGRTIVSASGNNRPIIVPLGDAALLVRFANVLDDAANRRALDFAAALSRDPPSGMLEIVPSLVSVLVRYTPLEVDVVRLGGELALRLTGQASTAQPAAHDIAVEFDGPDLHAVAGELGLTVDRFIDLHNAQPLRVLTTGFAPGFVYCGFHPPDLVVPRRQQVRPAVPAGSILFAAGQTAIAATEIPTGWHVIGRTAFRNFDARRQPPTELRAGDLVRFRIAP